MTLKEHFQRCSRYSCRQCVTRTGRSTQTHKHHAPWDSSTSAHLTRLGAVPNSVNHQTTRMDTQKRRSTRWSPHNGSFTGQINTPVEVIDCERLSFLINRLLTGLYWGDLKDRGAIRKSFCLPLSLSPTVQSDGEAGMWQRYVWEADAQHCVAVATEKESGRGGDGEKRERERKINLCTRPCQKENCIFL